jgi:hypothetical protein
MRITALGHCQHEALARLLRRGAGEQDLTIHRLNQAGAAEQAWTSVLVGAPGRTLDAVMVP